MLDNELSHAIGAAIEIHRSLGPVYSKPSIKSA
jgi:hypothetical protein